MRRYRICFLPGYFYIYYFWVNVTNFWVQESTHLAHLYHTAWLTLALCLKKNAEVLSVSTSPVRAPPLKLYLTLPFLPYCSLVLLNAVIMCGFNSSYALGVNVQILTAMIQQSVVPSWQNLFLGLKRAVPKICCEEALFSVYQVNISSEFINHTGSLFTIHWPIQTQKTTVTFDFSVGRV